jgi:hypothetical protein
MLASYSTHSPHDRLSLIGGHTISIDTPEGKRLFVSSQELPQIWGVIPYARAILRYEQVVNDLASAMGFTNRNSANALNVFKNLPDENWRNDLDPAYVGQIDEFIERQLTDETDRANFRKFVSSGVDWSGVSKKLNRSDWVSSAIPYVGEWLAVGAARRGDLVIALSSDPQIEAGLEAAIVAAEQLDGAEADTGAPDEDATRLTGGDNVLFYGAPGTGKSHAVDLRVGSDRAFRTVFHPDMQNSDFAGTLKPGLDGSDNVTYAFRPGPFASAVAYAWAHPDEPVYLVIEELNRAMAAAVFGELFQLLDRKADGTGRYQVDFPSPEFAQWFERETGSGMTSLRLPSNLWILATMNSADQGVYPLDTAFRRRWTQEYLPIDYSTAPAATVAYSAGGASRQTDWATFVEALNGFLVDNLQIGEDRLVGPRFASDSDLSSGKLPSKLLIYLWDDLLRHHGRDLLFATGIDTYGKLHQRTAAGKPIFSGEFLQRLGEDEDGAELASVRDTEANNDGTVE